MKKIWMVLIVSFVFLTMAACAGVTPAGDRIFRAVGKVATYEPGKVIKLQEGLEVTDLADGKQLIGTTGEYIFDITAATEVKGDIKPGDRVRVRYTAVGPGHGPGPKTAVSIEAL